VIVYFDCLHDMGDPQGAAAHALKTLKKPDGTVMIGRMFYAASTMVCVPASLSQNWPALGAQAGEAAFAVLFISKNDTAYHICNYHT
jgi:hypothetical protein